MLCKFLFITHISKRNPKLYTNNLKDKKTWKHFQKIKKGIHFSLSKSKIWVNSNMEYKGNKHTVNCLLSYVTTCNTGRQDVWTESSHRGTQSRGRQWLITFYLLFKKKIEVKELVFLLFSGF